MSNTQTQAEHIGLSNAAEWNLTLAPDAQRIPNDNGAHHVMSFQRHL